MSTETLSLIRKYLAELPMVTYLETAEAFVELAKNSPDELREALAEVEDENAVTALSRVSMRLWEESRDNEALQPILAEKSGSTLLGIQAWEIGKHIKDLRFTMQAKAMNNLCRGLESYLPAGGALPFKNEENVENLREYFETCALLREPAEQMQLAMMRLARALDRIQLPAEVHELVLSRLVAFAVRRNDTEALEACQKLVPDPVTSESLAFNLACSAARSGSESDLLRWTAKALELGNDPSAFQEDSDFDGFRDVAAFKVFFE